MAFTIPTLLFSVISGSTSVNRLEHLLEEVFELKEIVRHARNAGGQACPTGYHAQRCTTGWTWECGEGCARSHCDAVDGKWIQLDYSTNPYTCEMPLFSACPPTYERPLRCIASWSYECGEGCHRNNCDAVGGTWIPLDYQTNPYTCELPAEKTTKCQENNGDGWFDDDDCLDCGYPPMQRCTNGGILTQEKVEHGCTKATCTLPVDQCDDTKFGINFCDDWCNTSGYWGCGIGYLAGGDPRNTDNVDFKCDCTGCNGCGGYGMGSGMDDE